MELLKRFGVSIDEKLLRKFDDYIKSKSYKNRSEALRDLVRKELVNSQWADDSSGEVAGAIIIVYDHYQKELVDSLVNIQHDYHTIIISSQHVHIDHGTCLEIIAVKGRITDVFELEAKLKVVKGVKHALLAKSTLGEEL